MYELQGAPIWMPSHAQVEGFIEQWNFLAESTSKVLSTYQDCRFRWIARCIQAMSSLGEIFTSGKVVNNAGEF